MSTFLIMALFAGLIGSMGFLASGRDDDDAIREGNGGAIDVGRGGDAGIADIGSTRLPEGTLRNDSAIMVEGADAGEEIAGTDGGDDLQGGAGEDVIQGGRGDDRIRGGDGNDWLDGGRGSDVIGSGRAEDTIFGGKGTISCAVAKATTRSSPALDRINSLARKATIT